MKIPSDTKIRKAFLADLDQFMVDSLTPDRGYAIGVTHLKKLFESMTVVNVVKVDKKKKIYRIKDI